jgi:hypothetical protein
VSRRTSVWSQQTAVTHQGVSAPPHETKGREGTGEQRAAANQHAQSTSTLPSWQTSSLPQQRPSACSTHPPQVTGTQQTHLRDEQHRDQHTPQHHNSISIIIHNSGKRKEQSGRRTGDGDPATPDSGKSQGRTATPASRTTARQRSAVPNEVLRRPSSPPRHPAASEQNHRVSRFKSQQERQSAAGREDAGQGRQTAVRRCAVHVAHSAGVSSRRDSPRGDRRRWKPS